MKGVCSYNKKERRRRVQRGVVGRAKKEEYFKVLARRGRQSKKAKVQEK